MKKVLALLLASLVLLLTACTSSEVIETTAPVTTSTPSATTAPSTEPAPATETLETPGTTTPGTISSSTTTPALTTSPSETTTPADAEKIEIGNAEQLLAFMKSPILNGNYILTSDIVLNDISNVSDWTNTAPAVVWTPVGSDLAPFTGTFDGQGHSITGIYVNVYKYAGLFGCINGAKVTNLIIGKGYISATGTTAGGISAYYFGETEVSNCVNLATVTATDFVGGILGRHLIAAGCNITVLRCVNRGRISGTITTSSAGYAGGIVGICVGMTIDSCANFGDVSIGLGGTMGAIVGGIAGLMGSSQGYSETITNCFNTGTITSTQASGNAATAGIVGRMNASNGEVANCYNIGNIFVGGTSLVMTAYVAAENKDHLDYTRNLYNTGKMIVSATGAEIKPAFTEKGLIGEVSTGIGAVQKMNFDNSIWIDSASGAPILRNIDASWQTLQ